MNILKTSSGILKRFTLRLNKNNFERFATYYPFYEVRLRNISFDLKGISNFGRVLKFLNHFKNSIENLHVSNAKLNNYKEFYQFYGNLQCVKSLSFQNFGIDNICNEKLPNLSTLEYISFEKCNDNVFIAFKDQSCLNKIKVCNNDWTWNGFPHEIFNAICEKSNLNLEEIILIGAGTGSYFDADEFPYNVRKLETSMITFHWYVGIKSARVSFLTSQLGHLKDLTIHQLPNDFDGGRVLDYILDKVKLDNFHYGKIPLILNGKKQPVTEFSATEIQIKASMALMHHFPCKFKKIYFN